MDFVKCNWDQNKLKFINNYCKKIKQLKGKYIKLKKEIFEIMV